MTKRIAKKGNSEYSIVIPNNAHIIEKTAAEELASYFEKALGVKLPTVSEERFFGKGIYIGKTEFAEKHGVVGKSKENWMMKMLGDNIILTGGEEIGDRGIIYSVYHFIEDVLGVRWFSPFEEDVPSLKKLALDDNFYKEGTPDFSYRKPLLCPACGRDGYVNMVRNRINSVSAIDDGIENGARDEFVRRYGDVMHVGRPHHVHVFGKLFPREEYFEKHPEWWAWNKVNKKYMVKGHNCLKNEEFFDAFVKKLLSFIEEDIKFAKEEGIEFPFTYSLSPDDLSAAAFCQCEKCEALIKEAGYGGYLMDFGNRVVREINKKYPFVKLEMLAYSDFVEPPKNGLLPEKNLSIKLADVCSDIFCPTSSYTNENYGRLLRAWSEVCKKSESDLYIYDYMYNIRLNYPLPLFSRVKELVCEFKNAGVKGVFVETQNDMADMWELNKYMLTHLLEDTSLDAEKLCDDFMKRYYGKAAKYVKKYIKLLEKCAERNEVYVYCCLEGSPFNYIDAKTAIEGDALLEKALSAVGRDEKRKCRVAWLRKPLDTVILMKYADLKAQAKREGRKFPFDADVLRARIESAIDEHIKTEKLASSSELENEKKYILSLSDEEDEFVEYEEISTISRERVYQFPMKRMIKFVQPNLVRIYGQSVVYDEDIGREVMKLSYDEGTGFGWDLEMVPTGKDDANPRPIRFMLLQNRKKIEEISFFKEDLNHDGYVLYKVGSFKDVMKNPHTRLFLFAEQNVSVNIRGIAVTHPFDECDVYLSMKFSGEKYGGSPDAENAVYFDRMVIVKK